ncbi:hypothetical protein ES708_22487 [subsurface metagenome]
MPHGQPDFGMYSIAETIYRLSDMAELAVRLGSIVRHDRRGDVIWLDDFESEALKWWVYGGTSGGSFAQSGERARSGAFSGKLVTGGTGTNYLAVQSGIFYPVMSRVGYEISVHLHDDVGAFTHYFWSLDGTHKNWFGLGWQQATRVLSVYDKTLGWTPIDDDIYLWAGGHVFSTIKLVVDLATLKYVRAIINREAFDLSAYTAYQTDLPGAPSLQPVAWVAARDDKTPSVYIDDAIITQNEP